MTVVFRTHYFTILDFLTDLGEGLDENEDRGRERERTLQGFVGGSLCIENRSSMILHPVLFKSSHSFERWL